MRQTLDEMVDESARKGFATFEAPASRLAGRVAVLPIVAGLEEAEQNRFEALLDEVLKGVAAE